MQVLLSMIFSFLILSFTVYGMEQVGNEVQQKDGDYETSLQDVQWAIRETQKDFEDYKKLPNQNFATVKGWLNSYWNLVCVTKWPGFFVGVHLVKCAAVFLLIKGWFHLSAEIPETELSFYSELGISAAYPTLETAYVTWENRDRKFKDKTD